MKAIDPERAAFPYLWGAAGVSEVGNQITAFAAPTIVVLILHGGPLAVALVGISQYLAFPILGVHSGTISESHSRRTVMIVADLCRAALICSVPVAGLLGDVGLAQILLVTVLAGVLGAYFEVAAQSVVPRLASKGELIVINSRFNLSRNAAAIVGPALAAVLVRAIGPVQTLWADAGSFLVSALAVQSAARLSPHSWGASNMVGPREHSTWLAGSRFIWSQPLLRSITLCTATTNLGFQVAQANYLVFAYRELRLSAPTIGVIYAAGAVFGLCGSMIARRVFGGDHPGRMLALCSATSGVSWFVVALGRTGLPALMLLIACVMVSFSLAIYDTAQLTYRQALTPEALQSRVHAAARAMSWAPIPVGFLIGGIVGQTSSPLVGVVLGGTIASVGFLWFSLTPANGVLRNC